jgi:hypothetical protein
MEENWIIFSDVGIEFSLPLLEEIGHKKKVRDPSLESEEYVIIALCIFTFMDSLIQTQGSRFVTASTL